MTLNFTLQHNDYKYNSVVMNHIQFEVEEFFHSFFTISSPAVEFLANLNDTLNQIIFKVIQIRKKITGCIFFLNPTKIDF